jgi:hypothetical protein
MGDVRQAESPRKGLPRRSWGRRGRFAGAVLCNVVVVRRERPDSTVALVTRASSGIGGATALALAEAGASLAPVARRADRLTNKTDPRRIAVTEMLIRPTEQDA